MNRHEAIEITNNLRYYSGFLNSEQLRALEVLTDPDYNRLTLREELTKAALQGILVASTSSTLHAPEMSVAMADATIKWLNKTNSKNEK